MRESLFTFIRWSIIWFGWDEFERVEWKTSHKIVIESATSFQLKHLFCIKPLEKPKIKLSSMYYILHVHIIFGEKFFDSIKDELWKTINAVPITLSHFTTELNMWLHLNASMYKFMILPKEKKNLWKIEVKEGIPILWYGLPSINVFTNI